MTIPSLLLEGKVAIVTGGKGGIGSVVALTLAKAGADVAVASRTIEDGKLQAVADQIKGLGQRSLATKADITKKTDVENMVERVMDNLGHIDILVNTPTLLTADVPLVELSEEEWDKVIDTKLKGYFLCSQAVAKRMIERKSGNIISFSGDLAFRASRGRPAYAVAQAGVVMLTKVMALELAPYNIRVNAVAPTLVNKMPLSRYIWSDIKALEAWKKAVPQPLSGRLIEASDVADAVLFLASDASSFITGLTLPVDGGALIV